MEKLREIREKKNKYIVKTTTVHFLSFHYGCFNRVWKQIFHFTTGIMIGTKLITWFLKLLKGKKSKKREKNENDTTVQDFLSWSFLAFALFSNPDIFFRELYNVWSFLSLAYSLRTYCLNHACVNVLLYYMYCTISFIFNRVRSRLIGFFKYRLRLFPNVMISSEKINNLKTQS